MNQSLISLSVASDGSVFGIDPDTGVVTASPAPSWTTITGNLWAIAAGSDGTLFGIGANDTIFTYTNGAWASVPCSYALTQISVGSAQNVWGIDAKQVVYQYTQASGWQPVPGQALISISAASDNSVTGLDASGAAWQYSDGQWVPIAGTEPLVALSAGSADWILGISKSGIIYQFDGTGDPWLPLPGPNIPSATSISCGDDTTVWVLDSQGNAFFYDATAQGWNPIPALPAGSISQVSVGNASNIWCIGDSNNVYNYTQGTRIWTAVTPASSISLSQIAVGSAANIWAIDTQGNIYCVTGGASNWNPKIVPWGLDSEPEMLSVAADRTVLAVSQETLYQFSESGSWTELTSAPQLTLVSTGGAENIWGLDGSGSIWQYSGTSGWVQVGGLAAMQLTTAADGVVYALDSTGTPYLYLGPGEDWYQIPSTLKAISAGSALDLWGIDPNGYAVQVISPSQTLDGSIARGRKGLGWDTEDPFNEAQSTHLWIVNRAVLLASQDPVVGSQISTLIQPNESETGPTGNEFHDQLCQGLYDADFLPQYNNPALLDHVPTYKSHFYDPDTGENWMGDKSPTALTQCRLFFWTAINEYLAGNPGTAGYNLGLALHYFTDANQPMHAANFTYLSSWPTGYHTAFESYVLANQSSVSSPANFTLGTYGIDPSAYLIASAQNAQSKYFRTICPIPLQYNGSISPPLKAAINSVLSPMLQDAISNTAQFIVAWMMAANSDNANCVLVCAANAMVIAGASRKADKPLVVEAWRDDISQRFTLLSLTGEDEGYCKIAHQQSGLVLDTGGSTVSSTIVQQNWTGSDTQKWQLYIDSNNTMAIVNKNSGLALTFPSAATGKAQLTQSGDESLPTQRWLITPGNSMNIMLVSDSTGPLVAKIKSGSRKAGRRVQLDTPNRKSSRRFLFVPLAGADDGYYAILAACSGLALAPDTDSGDVVQQVWDPGNDSMKWSQDSEFGSDGISLQCKTGGSWGLELAAKAGVPVLNRNSGGSEWNVVGSPSNANLTKSTPELVGSSRK